ncbi:MAG: peptidylprolyl isomerase [Oscillospiraceae bacterium]|nr:peptidylprolyl isomerase [Oscillospiraceae bacterium]
MKRFIFILLAILVVFGAVSTAVSLNQKPEETAAPAIAPTPETAAQTEPAASAGDRRLDYDALRALHGADETVMSLGGESVSWAEYCDWLSATGRQIEDYFQQMAAYYGMSADWGGSVGDDSGMNFAQYAVHETNESLSSVLAYRCFAAEKQLSLSEEEQEQLTDEALAKSLLGEDATVEAFKAALEEEGFGLETYRRIRETNQLLEKYYDETYGAEGEKVSDEDVLAYLEEEGFVTAAQILLRTIDPNTGEKLDEAVVAEKLLRAEELTEELRAVKKPEKREARFLKLKEKFCEDGGKAAYPDGYTYTPGTLLEPLEKAAAALEPYEVSDPVETYYGYHVIMRLPLRADCLLYSAQGMPVSARAEVAAVGMSKELDDFVEANPVVYADGIEDLDLMKFIK